MFPPTQFGIIRKAARTLYSSIMPMNRLGMIVNDTNRYQEFHYSVVQVCDEVLGMTLTLKGLLIGHWSCAICQNQHITSGPKND